MSNGLVTTTNKRIFTRRTMVSETEEGLQAANVQVFIYSDEDLAYDYHKAQVTYSKWQEALNNGECFFEVPLNDGGRNTIFLEVRYVIA